MRRMGKVKIKWSPNFAYAIGLLTTDGNLSKDGRHMNLTSKDEEMIVMFKKCIGIENKIGRKTRGGSKIKKYFQVQFGDKNFYEFLVSIGLAPAKSKILKSLNIPNEYLADFVRGCIDGDGSIGAYQHPESRHPQLRIRLYSASPLFLEWIKSAISKNFKIKTGWIEEKGRGLSCLVYAKHDSIKLISFMYYSNVEYCLLRKYNIARPFMRV